MDGKSHLIYDIFVRPADVFVGCHPKPAPLSRAGRTGALRSEDSGDIRPKSCIIKVTKEVAVVAAEGPALPKAPPGPGRKPPSPRLIGCGGRVSTSAWKKNSWFGWLKKEAPRLSKSWS
jgi:hypothetical protein